MDQPILPLIDRARQRHLTENEIVAVENSARRAALGTDAAERLAPREAALVEAAVKAVESNFPQLETEIPGATNLLRHSATLVLRQVGLAVATDDPEHLSRALRELQRVHSDAALGGDVVRCAFDALRNAVMADLTAAQRSSVDCWLTAATGFLAATSEIALFRDDVFKAVTEAAGGSVGSDAAAIAFREDARIVLDAATLDLLPGGTRFHFDALRALYEKTRRTRSDGESSELWTRLDGACRGHLSNTAAEPVLRSIADACRFLAAAYDLAAHIDEIARASVRAHLERHPDRSVSDDERSRMEAEQRTLLEHALFASIAGGREVVIEAASDLWLSLRKANEGGMFVGGAYDTLLATCRERLGQSVQSFLLPALTGLCGFVSLAAHLAEHQDAMLTGVVDGLARDHGEFFRGESIARAYVIRDQEQLLHNLALALVPGAETVTEGRFAIFAETLATRAFPVRLMTDSFSRLEEACRQTLPPPVFAHIENRWSKLRRRFEDCVKEATRAAARPTVASAA